MRIIPEYEPVGKLYLSFVRNFYHTRFDYGQTICDMISSVPEEVDVEVFISSDETAEFMDLLDVNAIRRERVDLNTYSPLRGILAEYFPVFCQAPDGGGVGLHFKHEKLDLADYLHRFSGDIIDEMGFRSLRMKQNFATAKIAINDDLCLISEEDSDGEQARARLDFFRENFPDQHFEPVEPLAGDNTKDLDMFLWPILPEVWLVSEYPRSSPQAASVEPTVRKIREYGHQVIRIPGLPKVEYSDVNTMPNYANGVVLNDVALCPFYDRSEDRMVYDILESLGYGVKPIDCRKIIESNSGLHCISKTVPSALLGN
jgi:hypothetical protein